MISAYSLWIKHEKAFIFTTVAEKPNTKKDCDI